MPTPREFLEALGMIPGPSGQSLFGLLGEEVPPESIGRGTPPEFDPRDPVPQAPREEEIERFRCPCPPRPQVDPDLVEEFMELQLDELLFREDC